MSNSNLTLYQLERGADERAAAVELPGPHYGWAYRLSVLIGFLAIFFLLYFLQQAIWPRGRLPGEGWELALSWFSLAWVLPLPPAMLGLIGVLTFRRPLHREVPYATVPHLVSFRVVTRGTNERALRATVRNIHATMASTPLFAYRVEVVTDRPIVLESNARTVQLVVPPDYRTPRSSLYKARALQFALDTSDLRDDVWIMHLDEESHITRSLCVGLARAVAQEEHSGRHRIGQGVILYHRSLFTHRFLTLADMIRTGEDLGRFHFQHRLGITLFGLHGSFILVRNSVEKQVGFDFGPVGSLTEDAFWALREMELGRRCRWVDGYVVEQGTHSIGDFIRQRRRWFLGLVLVSLRSPSPLRWRLALGVSSFLWSISWVAVLYTYLNLITGLNTALWIQLGGDFVFAFYVIEYILGLKVNLDHLPPVGRLQAARYYGLLVVLVPVFQLLEGCAVLYGLVRPNVHFHIVQK